MNIGLKLSPKADNVTLTLAYTVNVELCRSKKLVSLAPFVVLEAIIPT